MPPLLKYLLFLLGPYHFSPLLCPSLHEIFLKYTITFPSLFLIFFLLILKHLCYSQSQDCLFKKKKVSWNPSHISKHFLYAIMRVIIFQYMCVGVFSAHSCLPLFDPMDSSPLCSSVHGISQTRMLKWVAISFSRGPSWLRDWSHISCIAGGFLPSEPPEAPHYVYIYIIMKSLHVLWIW